MDSVAPATQEFRRLKPGYLKRVLLTILDREEYSSVINYHENRSRIESKSGVEVGSNLDDLQIVRNDESVSQVRISDLRLAADLRPGDLKRELDSTLSSLPLPVSTDCVKRWKWETLSKYKTRMKNPSEWTESEAEEEERRVTAVSFAAAALLLLHDLDMVNLETATHKELKSYTIELQGIISTLIERLDASTDELDKLLRHRRGRRGRPADPEAKAYKALHLHRMGVKANKVAQRVGITPAHRVEGRWEGSKDWKKRLRDLLAKGVEIERDRFPAAAEVFDHEGEQTIQDMARRAYNLYLEERFIEPPEYIDVKPPDDLLLDNKDPMRRAFIQLGACLEKDIPPFPLP